MKEKAKKELVCLSGHNEVLFKIIQDPYRIARVIFGLVLLGVGLFGSGLWSGALAQIEESSPAVWTETELEHYTSLQTTDVMRIDGILNEPVWQKVRKSPRFVDMISGQPGFFDTRAAVVWNEENLYVAFWVEEPFVSGKVTDRDATIFRENDVEVFIDGIDSYYEFEINALNTIYEVFFIWKDAYKQTFDIPEFDVHSIDAYTFGGNHDRGVETFWRGTHPRGSRWAFPAWDFPGLQSAVRIEGTLNMDQDIDHGWTVEIAFPWAGMKHLAGGRSLPPVNGDEWRIFFGRFEKLPVGNRVVSPAWSWGRIGDGDNHIPERFTVVKFSTQPVL
jgi:hypothetical protein